jgi:thiamine-monophosphate kinase
MSNQNQSIAELGEWGLIAALAARMPGGEDVEIGIGDDAAIVAVPGGRVVAAVDLVLAGRHFLLSWSTGRDVGVKAAARSLADIAAMGAVPSALLVGLAAPGSLPARWALDLACGLADEAARAGASVVGGDTAASDSVALSVTALGSLPGRAITRSGARPGDVVAVAGRLGWSAAGYALLSAGLAVPNSAAAAPEPGDAGVSAPEPSGAGAAYDAGLAGLITAHLRPSPPYDAGPEAAGLGATAMIDTSDGLLADLGHIARSSGARIDVHTSALEVGDQLRAGSDLLSRTSGSAADPVSWILTGGEDHALAATFPPDVSLPPRWRVIGSVLPRAGGPDVLVDGSPYADTPGWQHFRAASGEA